MRVVDLRNLVLAAALLGVLAPRSGAAEGALVEPRALETVRASTRYVAGLERFAFEADSTLDVVLGSGQKLQFDNAAKVTVRRPNRLRAERVGDLVDQVFLYDGAQITLHDRSRGYYATVAAPATLDQALDFARDALDIVAPAADLLYTDAFEALTQHVTSGTYLGESMIGGVRCDHVAFTGPEVDWQLWVEQGERPLPRKYVITSKDVTGAPQFSVWIRRVDLALASGDEVFAFAAPEGAQRIEFLTLTARKPAGAKGAGETR